MAGDGTIDPSSGVVCKGCKAPNATGDKVCWRCAMPLRREEVVVDPPVGAPGAEPEPATDGERRPARKAVAPPPGALMGPTDRARRATFAVRAALVVLLAAVVVLSLMIVTGEADRLLGRDGTFIDGANITVQVPEGAGFLTTTEQVGCPNCPIEVAPGTSFHLQFPLFDESTHGAAYRVLGVPPGAGWSVSFSPTQFSLTPGGEQIVDANGSAPSSPGSYFVPTLIQSGSG